MNSRNTSDMPVFLDSNDHVIIDTFSHLSIGQTLTARKLPLLQMQAHVKPLRFFVPINALTKQETGGDFFEDSPANALFGQSASFGVLVFQRVDATNLIHRIDPILTLTNQARNRFCTLSHLQAISSDSFWEV
jgi:hypothetical protein